MERSQGVGEESGAGEQTASTQGEATAPEDGTPIEIVFSTPCPANRNGEYICRCHSSGQGRIGWEVVHSGHGEVKDCKIRGGGTEKFCVGPVGSSRPGGGTPDKSFSLVHEGICGPHGVVGRIPILPSGGP